MNYNINNNNNNLCIKKMFINHTEFHIRLVWYRFVVMPDVTIKLFRFVRNCFQMMGCIHPSNQNRSINLQNSFFFIPVLLMFSSTTGYIIFKATSILEYAATLYVSTTELAIMVNFMVTYLKIENILQLIEMMEKLIQQSKFQYKFN